VSAARFHRTSANKKLSPVGKLALPHADFKCRPVPRAPFCSSTYVSIEATCSDACPFKRGPNGERGGCFIGADYFTQSAMRKLDAGAEALLGREVILQEVEEIDRTWPRGVPQDGARGGRDLRLHVGGDVPDELSAHFLAGAAAAWRARGGGAVWTYTHSWRSVTAGAFWPISVLASVETPEDVQLARGRGYVPALVVEEFPDGKRPFKVGGTRFIPCPAETLGKTCVECRLCLDAPLRAMGAGIAFAIHGRDAAAAKSALVQLGGRRQEAA
jgi:hypothetical protein